MRSIHVHRNARAGKPWPFPNSQAASTLALLFLGVAFPLLIVAIVMVFSSQGASGSPVTSITSAQEQLCPALSKALPKEMVKAVLTPGFDQTTRSATCTAIDAHANAVTFSQRIGSNGKQAFKTILHDDDAGSGYGCSTPDRGQLDTSPFNDVKSTTQAYGCNLTAGETVTERVDALTSDNRVVAISLTCGSEPIRWSSQTIADVAIPALLAA